MSGNGNVLNVLYKFPTGVLIEVACCIMSSACLALMMTLLQISYSVPVKYNYLHRQEYGVAFF